MNSEKKLKEHELVQRCLKNDRKAQKELYERYGPLMKMVCIRYLYQKALAEEVMNRGFYKVFKNLKDYRQAGSFEGWIRTTMVRECLNENKAHKVSYELTEEEADNYRVQMPEIGEKHDLDFILKIIDALPMGYKMVLNLNEIEGYSHREIAEKLEISESASRSQLARAKKILRERLMHLALERGLEKY